MQKGGVAQWLEQSAHNRLVAGSSPAAPTTMQQIKTAKPKGYGGFLIGRVTGNLCVIGLRLLAVVLHATPKPLQLGFAFVT